MDVDHAYHTGWSYWKGQLDNDNTRDSFGIELMHKPKTPYPGVQIESLLRLLKELVHAHPTIKPERVIGHSEIATTDKKKALLNRVLNRRPEDPGPLFPWDKLRKLPNPLGVPVRPTAPPIGSSDLLTFFKDFPDAQLQPGDDDKTFTYGGQPRDPSKVPAQLITTLQTRLNAIGYSCVPTGHYNFQTQMAVSAFQMNFVQDEALKNSIRQQVTRKTAEMIERVA
jgi:N-acetyl-anhydromuramyl-L-alanine amidase AmpD